MTLAEEAHEAFEAPNAMPRLRTPVLPSLSAPIVTWGDVFRRGVVLVITVAITLLVLFGLVSLGSLTFGITGAFARTVFYRQVFALVIGFCALLLFSHIDYRILRTLQQPLLVFTVLMLTLLLFFGVSIHGSRAWVVIGGVSIQVSELAKFSFLISLAGYAARWTRQLKKISHLLVSLLGTAVFVVLIFFEPDFGTAAVYVLVWVSFILALGIERRQLAPLALAFGGLAMFLWIFVLVPYQKERIHTFLNPGRDPLGAGYNLQQSLVAIGSGGLWGRGFAQGSQSQFAYLPEAQSDFVFSVVGETFGFVGISIVLVLWVCLLASLLFLTLRLIDEFAAFFTLGFALLLFWEVTLPIAIALSFLPVTGLALPFMSAGGTSLVVHLAMLGTLLNILKTAPLRVREDPVHFLQDGLTPSVPM